MSKRRPERLIWAQGALDGACFLYGLVNAAQCFTHEYDRLSDRWGVLTEKLACPGNFLNWQQGTGDNDAHPDRNARLADELLNVLSPKEFCVSVIKFKNDFESLKGQIHSGAVVLIDDGEHWSCIVDLSQRTAYVADSAELVYGTSEYRERTSTRLGRVYNVTVPLERLKPKQAILIERAV